MGNSTRPAPMQPASKDDDWTKVEDRAARRKIQNRRAQRRHREKIREHIAQLQAQVASASRDSTPMENMSEPYDGYSDQPSSSRAPFAPLKRELPSPNMSRIPPQEHDPSHLQEDHQNGLTEQWNGSWSYFSGHDDIFDNVYPPTPPQELCHTTSPIICSALPRSSPQSFPSRPQMPVTRSPRPHPGRSMTSPQLPVANPRNGTWPQQNNKAPADYTGGLSIKREDPAPSSAPYSRGDRDPHMPQLSYPRRQTPQAPIHDARNNSISTISDYAISASSRAAMNSSIICSNCAQSINLDGDGDGGRVRYIAIPVDTHRTRPRTGHDG